MEQQHIQPYLLDVRLSPTEHQTATTSVQSVPKRYKEMPELFFSCPAALEEVLAGICAGAGVSRADKDTLLNWKTPGDADDATLRALKRALDAQSGPASHNLRSFLCLHAFTPVLRSRSRECGVALESKEARRDELRARQQHRDYNGLVADLRKSEIEQVGLEL